jgi:hypothetical protein
VVAVLHRIGARSPLAQRDCAVTVKPLTPSFSQRFQTSELAGSLDGAGVIEARVVSMLDGGKVRLAILGQTVDVSTPHAFRPGTLIAAVINRRSGKLQPIAQQNVPEAVSGGSGDSSAQLRIGAAESRIFEALLGIGSNVENLLPLRGLQLLLHSQQVDVSSGPVVQAQLQAEVRTRYGLDPASGGDQTIDGGLGIPRPPSPRSGTAKPAEVLSSSGLPVAHNPVPGPVIPLQLPEMPHPVPVRIVQEDENARAGEDGLPAQPSSAVTVSLEAVPPAWCRSISSSVKIRLA